MNEVIEKELVYKNMKYHYSIVEKTKDKRKMLLFIDPIIANGIKFWIPFIRINQLAEEYKMIYVCGYYGYDENGKVSNIENIADVYNEIFMRENCDNISFISYSFGSYAGNLFCTKYENIIAKAVYICPTFCCSDRAYHAYQKLKDYLKINKKDYFEKFVVMIGELMKSPDAKPSEKLEDFQESLLESGELYNPLSSVIQSVETALNESEQNRTTIINVDTVVIYGEEDYMAPYEMQEELKRNYNMIREYMYEGGHDVIHKSIFEIRSAIISELT